ncbi:MAG: DUF1501 domain-containing protein [Verrucomicrobia subdivision 3 bacterium]|nr:DUF1501 domain-containing protein [Limisphaerales bacterium]
MNSIEINRRTFFDRVGDGLYGAALASLLTRDLYGTERHHKSALPTDTQPRQPHFAPRAKAVIQFCMQGGPSQVDLFDPKPALETLHGKDAPEEFTKVAPAGRSMKGHLMRSHWKFAQYGQSGAWVSELLPETAKEMDHIAVIRSMFNVHENHEPACYKWQSGETFPGHPTMGSWITYGLGSVNQNLPAYVVLADPQNRLPVNGVENWMSGYLPPLFQGTSIKSEGTPMLHLKPDFKEPAGVSAAKHNLINALDRIHKAERPNQHVLDSRIANYQMAARMQVQATEALDVSTETESTRKQYGIGGKETDNFGKRCLMARRLVERGVRLIQIYPKGQMWDNHNNIKTSLPAACKQSDLPTAGLLRDLRQRGLLDDVLILWGGEFGRLPMAQGEYAKAGRDHGPSGFTNWMAGGGVKGGTVYGETDDIGFGAVKDRVSIQDWHATILHQLGMNHEKLFFDRNGLHERLTHTHPTRVVKEILA